MVDAANALHDPAANHTCPIHETHDRRLAHVDPRWGITELHVHDGHAYSGTHGYCTGDDDVSRCILDNGYWESRESSVFLQALTLHPGPVIDFGMHVGWFSTLALARRRDVLGIEGDGQNSVLARINASHIGRSHDLFAALHWLNKSTPYLSDDGAPVFSMVKIDVEGAEEHALRCVFELLETDKVASLMMEVSPVFNDTYDDLVQNLMYRHSMAAAVIEPWHAVSRPDIHEAVHDQPQSNWIFSRIPWWDRHG